VDNLAQPTASENPRRTRVRRLFSLSEKIAVVQTLVLGEVGMSRAATN
jgi:hypothetical protein